LPPHSPYSCCRTVECAGNSRSHANVPPYSTLLVVNELIKANKDFDLILLPNRTHGFGNEPYMVRRRWDYFVKNLLGAEPPKEYEIKPGARPRVP
jgi:hypothetical protein